MKVTYSSCNSGGHWWLKDADWKKLQKAGWKVMWVKKDPLYKKWGTISKDGRFLGALAKYASKNFKTLKEAIEEWESVVGLDASDEGCNCCGPPHSFRGEKGGESQWASGKDVVGVLYDNAPTSLREAAERLKKG
jgi:hypothetical protein